MTQTRFPKEPARKIDIDTDRGRRWWLQVVAAVAATGIAAFGCDADRSETSVRERGPRIVSLSPAMTTMLVDVGAKDAIVGRTPWCREIDDRPVVGTLEGVDAELLVSLEPGLVVHQPPSTGTDPVLQGLRDRLGFELIGGRLDGVDDIQAVLAMFDAHDLGDPEKIEAWQARLRRTFGEPRAADLGRAARPPIRMLVLHSVDPFGVAGTGTYLDDVIVAAGGENVLGGEGWSSIGAEAVLGLEPEVVLVVGSVGTKDMSDRLDGLGWAVPPVVLRVESADVLEPSTRICVVVEQVDAMLRASDVRGDGS